ncbi:MAG: hypothetical protein AW09_001744 [Candidatus Accumulibacter phosphatis]|uniref:Uncharacterized protein n=1 Tax=Candidatus Accumulibacter phosphatis TaxID=327160 RepID=A0A080LWI4_9PROT|nr:MAG: hypothetical protein AW09_001744 [Candidatus Accumulibacter phosphatis]
MAFIQANSVNKPKSVNNSCVVNLFKFNGFPLTHFFLDQIKQMGMISFFDANNVAHS